MDFKQGLLEEPKNISVSINSNNQIYVDMHIPFRFDLDKSVMKEEDLHLFVWTIPYALYEECSDITNVQQICSHGGIRQFFNLNKKEPLEFNEPGQYHVIFILIKPKDKKEIEKLLEKYEGNTDSTHLYKEPLFLKEISSDMISGASILGYSEESLIAFV